MFYGGMVPGILDEQGEPMKDLLEELKEIRASEYARLEERIQRRSRQVREDLAREIKKRQDNGASIMDIAKELGYKTRQSVYNLLGEVPTWKN